ncbi:MxaD protein [Methyloceanibacter stevinii]|uniref:MxaD protein n=1 Tax=Methyloceanibacter stevinii TaxID=1774970 RepID=A0A1E3VQD5_9HYPH|nr:SRPBCC family protein [Methyloceanibacter stevinii]ODR95734.1 MxaD protein [Methyloceanibacter stevinii]
MTLFRIAVLHAFLLLGAASAAAHGPTPQKVEEGIAIAAPPAKVWDLVKNFDSLVSWNPLVETSMGTGGNEAGAERTVVLRDGGQLKDSLDEYVEEEMSYSYRLDTPDIEAFPVSFYSATLAVKPGADGGSEVTWDARLYRADTGNFPSEEQNDAAAIEAVTKFYKAGLEELKKKAEE